MHEDEEVSQMRSLSKPGSLGQPRAFTVSLSHLGTQEKLFSGAAAEPGTEGRVAASTSVVSRTQRFLCSVAG